MEMAEKFTNLYEAVTGIVDVVDGDAVAGAI